MEWNPSGVHLLLFSLTPSGPGAHCSLHCIQKKAIIGARTALHDLTPPPPTFRFSFTSWLLVQIYETLM